MYWTGANWENSLPGPRGVARIGGYEKGVSVFREVLRPVQPSAKGFAKGKGFVGLCQLKQPSSFRREDYDFLV